LIIDGAEPGLPTYTKSATAVQMLELVIFSSRIPTQASMQMRGSAPTEVAENTLAAWKMYPPMYPMNFYNRIIPFLS